MCRCTSDSVTYMCVCVFFFRFFSIIVIQFSLVQSLSRDWLFVPPWTAACLPVHHQLSEPAQTHVHRIDDAIQPSDPPLSLSPAFNLSQHQGLFKWVSSSHQVAKVYGVSASTSFLPMNIQDWFPLGCTDWISLQSKELWRIFSNTTVQKHQVS